MNIITQINKILSSNTCECFELDEKNLTITHKQSIDEARINICNHKVFSEITGLLVLEQIDYELTPENHIKIKLDQ